MNEPKKKFVQNELSGSLFVNKYKSRDSQPMMTGTCMIEGVEYKVAAFSKISASGMKYYSLAFRNADDLFPMGTGNPDVKPPMPDDEVPF